MGQAKRRGTYEERLQIATSKKAEELKASEEHKLAQELALTPQERNERRKAKLLIAQLLAFTNSALEN